MQLVLVLVVHELLQRPALEVAGRPGRAAPARPGGPGDLPAVVEHDRDVGGAVHQRAEVRLGAQHLAGQPGAVGGPHQRAHEGQRPSAPRRSTASSGRSAAGRGQAAEQQQQRRRSRGSADDDAGAAAPRDGGSSVGRPRARVGGERQRRGDQHGEVGRCW